MPVKWDINDPNGRIRSGRIRYAVTTGPDNKLVTIYKQKLVGSYLEHGEDHELTEAEQWDGTIREGLKERIGKKITADLSEIGVYVEVWNTTNPEPAKQLRKGRGRTERKGEWIAVAAELVEVDAIVEGKWDRDFVIPYDDPDEPDKGEAKMIIKVKNVRDGIPVEVEVYRIKHGDDSEEDHLYTDKLLQEASDQPGIHGLIVKDQRVVRKKDGQEPFVRFNNYEEHWKYPGNNFYCFRVGFGQGRPMVASERDFVKKEKQCLHFRFTVFIDIASLRDDYKNCGRQLWSFLKHKTKYFRPYKWEGRPQSVADIHKRYRRRYIVAIASHGSTFCKHGDHPKAKNKKGKLVPMDLYHQAFPPDKFVCPPKPYDTKKAKKQIQADVRHYKHKFGGCGWARKVIHGSLLGKHSDKKRRYWLVTPPDEPIKGMPWFVLSSGPKDRTIKVIEDGDNPQLLLWAGGCRQMTTGNFAERFTRNGTRYFHGWVYSVWIRENTKMCLDFFRRWIKGSPKKGPLAECDLSKLVPAYRAAAKRSYVVSCPRIVEGRHVLNPREASDAKEAALK